MCTKRAKKIQKRPKMSSKRSENTENDNKLYSQYADRAWDEMYSGFIDIGRKEIEGRHKGNKINPYCSFAIKPFRGKGNNQPAVIGLKETCLVKRGSSLLC